MYSQTFELKSQYFKCESQNCNVCKLLFQAWKSKFGVCKLKLKWKYTCQVVKQNAFMTLKGFCTLFLKK